MAQPHGAEARQREISGRATAHDALLDEMERLLGAQAST
jgi:hypothetical protein